MIRAWADDDLLSLPQYLGTAKTRGNQLIITSSRARRGKWTDAKLMALPKDGYKYELLDGEIIMSPASFDHGEIIARLLAAIANHVYAKDLGSVYDGQTGFRLGPNSVLSPDISFVTKARVIRLPPRSSLRKGRKGDFFPGAPDLAVEVLSPGETSAAINRKIELYFAHGTRLAWVIDPWSKKAFVYHAAEFDTTLSKDDSLSGELLLPNFRFPLRPILK